MRWPVGTQPDIEITAFASSRIGLLLKVSIPERSSARSLSGLQLLAVRQLSTTDVLPASGRGLRPSHLNGHQRALFVMGHESVVRVFHRHTGRERRANQRRWLNRGFEIKNEGVNDCMKKSLKYYAQVAAVAAIALGVGIGAGPLQAVAGPFQDQQHQQQPDYSKNKRYQQGMREGKDDQAHKLDHSKKRHFAKDEDQKAYEAGYQHGHDTK